jgi:aconitate hydratase
MSVFGHDSLKTLRTLEVGGKSYAYYSLEAAVDAGLGDIAKLPNSLKVLLENMLRWEDGDDGRRSREDQSAHRCRPGD